MRLQSSLVWLGMAAAVFMAARPVMAQEGNGNAAQPGPVHKQLAKYVGDYTTQTKFYTAPGAPAQESAGTAKITTAVGSRFLLEENSGTFFGRPLTGLRLYGYNNGSKQYEAIWTYSMSTGIMNLTGSSKDEGKTVSWTATYDDPKGKQTLYVTTHFPDDDHFVVELISKNPDGQQRADNGDDLCSEEVI